VESNPDRNQYGQMLIVHKLHLRTIC